MSFGDVFLQGYVDAPSVNTVISNYRSGISSDPPAFWQGDFFYDGYVASYDVNAVISNYHSGVTNTNPFPNASNVGTPISVTLPTTEPTLGTIIRNDVNWGDGNFDSYPAGVTTAYHTYTTPGTPEIQMTAVAADGGVYHPPAIPMAVSNTGVTATPLSLTASASTDMFAITADGDGNTIITQNGTVVEDEPTEDILALSITGGAENVSINFTNGDPLPIGGIFTDANIELDGPHGTDQLVTTSTAAYIGNDEIRYPANTTLTDNLTSDGGILAINGTTNLWNPAGDSLIVAPGATVFVNGSQTFSSLTIDAGATVRQISQDTTLGEKVLTLGTLTIANPDGSGNGGGVLDLGYGDLIATYASSSHDGGPDASVSESALGVIQQWLDNGYDGGNWDGINNAGTNQASIISSGAANDPYLIKSLGYAAVGADTTDGQLDISTFDGQTVYSGQTIVALTYYGDANLDRQVDSTDEGMIGSLSNTSSGAAGWTNGDFNYSGTVDVDFGQFTIVNVTTILLENGITTQPSTSFTPTGNISGGTTVGTPASVTVSNHSGTVTVTANGTEKFNDGTSNSDVIGLTFNLSDGTSIANDCHWIRTMTRTGTDASGAARTGTYPVQINDKSHHLITVTRNYNQSYADPLIVSGWDATVRPAQNIVTGVDAPNDSTLDPAKPGSLGGSATTIWTAHDYLVYDGVVIYEITWTCTETAATYPTRTYAVTSQGPATEIQDNPQKMNVGVYNNAPLDMSNPAYVAPAK